MLAAIGVSRDAGIDTNLIAGGAGEIRAGGPKDPENGANEPRQGVFIANVLKCRPPGNRNPLPEEIAQCEPYLRRQVALVRPKIILAMGRFAVQSLLQTSEPIGRLRGRVHRYQGVPVIVTTTPPTCCVPCRRKPRPGKTCAWRWRRRAGRARADGARARGDHLAAGPMSAVGRMSANARHQMAVSVATTSLMEPAVATTWRSSYR